ncbi:uroporphyrinogen-III C-methyltransferase [Pseudoroseomonas cervicalis]|uniref:uroporphyrinogen-III C-methyltransferase n=1 Tax=Teichococcus cervicalis TaxID=204525 RepID=UPI0027857611|nr:uroporphyrinogen-III C-methyltransferase [Pseudoroseomonas cervicalis]MDQ1080711.1 uroporphyrin-III C-methyltransferase [Pseudoroseomonas cervicalis]
MTRLEHLAALLGEAPPELRPGQVWLVGAGPGDPAKLTLEALAGLAQAELLVHDELVDPRILALAPEGAERRFMGKRGGQPSAKQADIIAALVAGAREGKRVVRLKGGDPYVFGRGAEEAMALAEAGIPCRVVPGLTAGLAGLAAAGIPATLRGAAQAVTLATAHAPDGAPDALDWAALARLGQPLVLYMAMRRLEAIAESLLAAGMPPGTPAAVVRAATTPEQQVLETTLADMPGAVRAAGLAGPAVVVLGAVVRARALLAPGAA